jgi:glutamate racemase
VAASILARRPDWAVSYAADGAFYPYGTRSDRELRERLPDLLVRLVQAASTGQPVDRVVIACNTASTLALQEVRGALAILPGPDGALGLPVVGVVPAIKPAASQSKTGVIGLLATPGTVRRAYTDRLIAEFAPDARVLRHGSATLVDLAERAMAGEDLPDRAFAEALAPLFQADPSGTMDVVVLACTHFPLVVDRLRAVAPWPVQFIDSGEAVARQTERVRPTAPQLAGAPAGPRAAWLTLPSGVAGEGLLARHTAVLGQFGFPPPGVV